jgi:AcrR family transcriptional regulator
MTVNLEPRAIWNHGQSGTTGNLEQRPETGEGPERKKACNGRQHVADETPELPGSLAAAWGLRERPGKGPKRGLSLEQIVNAALTVAAADGLAAVSMSRVAAELGVGTMSLYRYVDAKHDLLDLMVDTAMGPPRPADPGASWREGMSAWAWALLASYRGNLWAVQVPISGPPATPNALGWIEVALFCLRRTRLDEGQKMSVILLTSSFVRSEATLEAQLDSAVRAVGQSPSDLMAGYNNFLASVLDPRRFPELAMVAESGVLGKADHPDEEFTFGLERILDGVDVLVRGAGGED